jgi:O-antigen/teichoic acid export membrane protein
VAHRLRRRLAETGSRLVPAGGLRRGVAVLAGGNVVAAAVVALAYPIVSRLYAPEEFGAYAAAASLLALLLTVTCLTYERAVPLPVDEQVAADLLLVCAMTTVAITALTAAVLAIAGGRILGLFDAGRVASYWWILAGAQLVGGLGVALMGWAIRLRDFRAIASARVSQSIVSALVGVGAGLAGASAAGLVAGEACGRATGTARLLRTSARRLVRALAGTSRARLRHAARRYRRFPLLGTAPTLINAVGLEAPLLLLIAFYGAHTGGLFAFAQRLIGAPVSLVVVSVGQVFIAEAARQARTEVTTLPAFFRRTLRKLAMVTVPLMLAVGVAAAVLVEPMFGSAWDHAGTYILILVPFYTMQLVSSPLGGTLEVLERQDLLIVREVIRISLLTLAIVTAELLRLSAIWAVALLSAAGTLAYVIYTSITWYAVKSAAARAALADHRLARSGID